MTYICADLNIDAKILDTCTELFMTYGLRSVSMDDISRKLGISKKTLYQSVENKDDLVKNVIMRFIGFQENHIKTIISESSDAVEEYHTLARHFLTTLRQMKPTITYDLQKYYPSSWEIITKDHFSFIQDIIRNNIDAGIKQSLYRDDLDSDIIAKLYISKNHAIADESIFPLEKYNKDQLLIEFVRYHMYGIASEKGIKRMKQILKTQL